MFKIAVLLTLLAVLGKGTRKMEITQLLNTGNLVSATEDWLDWGIITPQGINYYCRTPGDGTSAYGLGWLRFSPGRTYSLNAWFGLDDVVTFSFMQYNFARANDVVNIITSGWLSKEPGYYMLNIYGSDMTAHRTIMFNVNYDSSSSSGSGNYMMLLHLTDDTASDS